MGLRQRFLTAAVAACALVCVLPAPAPGSTTQHSILIDDNQLIYSSPKHVARVLVQLSALGVDRLRVSVVWGLIAPQAKSTKRPRFNATDPNQYPAGAWDRYDMLARLCHELGIGLYFQVGPISPKWATAKDPSNQGPKLGRAPNLNDYRKFVEAVGRRYSGTFGATVPRNQPRLSLLGMPLPPLLAGGDPTPGQSTAIPRVSYWGVWNEPNERSWLNPWHRAGNRNALLQPSTYRGLANAAWHGLRASGHLGDTILIGETANVGIQPPLPFIRALYCVDSSDRPLVGSSASFVGCPRSGSRSGFRAANPGLFEVTGFAHHPYSFEIAPNRPYPDSSWLTLQNISVLENVLDQIFAAYGALPHGSVPLYLTEWGYKTNPPNPYVTTSLSDQAAWLNEGEYITWQLPYVRALAQFELVDDGPKRHTRPGSRAYWSTFQTGLEFAHGLAKPAYSAFRIPIWLPVARHGPRVTIWGQLRPANHAGAQNGEIQFRAKHVRKWANLMPVQTNSPAGFLVNHAALPSPGKVRLAWRNPRTGVVYYSRAVSVS